MRRYSSLLAVPIVASGDASHGKVCRPDAGLRRAHIQVDGLVDGAWSLEVRLSVSAAWVQVLEFSGNGLLDLGDVPADAYRLTCTAAPAGAGPTVTIAGWDSVG